MREIKNIGVLTSGGDAPGMNAAIRSVVRTGTYHGIRVYGIRKGYNGLITGDIHKIDPRDVSGIIKQGGTVLKTARCKAFMEEEGQKKAVSMAAVFALDAVVVIGGDGSYQGALALSRLGLPVMCLPGTIDNDIACTDYTIGYDTALNTAQEAIDKIRDTSFSHERCSVLEVMGRRAGYIALTLGITVGAEAIVIPEKTFHIENDVIRPLVEARNRGKSDFIVVVAEGVGGVNEIAKQITEKTGIEARTTILGHIQRGGSPTVQDRYMASLMGAKAVELLKKNKSNRAICAHKDQIIDIELEKALSMKKKIDPEIIRMSKVLSV